MKRRSRPLSAAVGLFSLVAVAGYAQSGDFEQGRVLSGPGHVLPHRDRVEPFNRMLEEASRGPVAAPDAGDRNRHVARHQPRVQRGPGVLQPGAAAGVRGPPHDDAGVLRPRAGQRRRRAADGQPLPLRRPVRVVLGGRRPRRAVAGVGRGDRQARPETDRRQRVAPLAGGGRSFGGASRTAARGPLAGN